MVFNYVRRMLCEYESSAHMGTTTCTASFFMLHLNNCAAVRRYVDRLQILNGGIKRQFESNKKYVFLMLQEYVKVAR
jgi:hypothetical protein